MLIFIFVVFWEVVVREITQEGHLEISLPKSFQAYAAHRYADTPSGKLTRWVARGGYLHQRTPSRWAWCGTTGIIGTTTFSNPKKSHPLILPSISISFLFYPSPRFSFHRPFSYTKLRVHSQTPPLTLFFHV